MPELEPRVWLTISGGRIAGTFDDLQGEMVCIRQEGGGITRIAIHNLNPNDQLRARTAAREMERIRALRKQQDSPVSLERLFGPELVSAATGMVRTADLNGRKIGIYFAAEWSPPCRAFTPKLAAARDALLRDGKPFEVVFASCDRDAEAMIRHMHDAEMPWPAIPFNEQQLAQLRMRFEVQGYPTLVVLDSSGRVAARDARPEVEAQGAAAYDAW
jgi:thiol-disulfide isomerase/thioredoxin